eukprot:CAMPEP_0182573068 /NCGR_PEP_ID=MMETSP1324-20130603/18059_1 /TAXON_ID=236786 /ORGANISM="Florenciella sp., Strain RCC1587" /LENGTH=43 /DNA_ID= /DNA_START= /DNA_END= /DNA_ORIENTATION=
MRDGTGDEARKGIQSWHMCPAWWFNGRMLTCPSEDTCAKRVVD